MNTRHTSWNDEPNKQELKQIKLNGIMAFIIFRGTSY